MTAQPHVTTPDTAPAPDRYAISAARLPLQPLRSPPRRPPGRRRIAPALLGLDIAAWTLGSLVDWRPADLLLVAGFVAFAAGAGLYRSRLTLSVLSDSPVIVTRAAVASVSVALIESARGGVPSGHFIAAVLLATLVTLACRGLCYAAILRLRRTGVMSHETLILGAGRVGAKLASLMLEHPEHGLCPIGFLDDDPLLGYDERAIPILGNSAALSHAIVRHGVRVVVLAFGSVRESALVDVIRTCDRLECEIFLVPRLFEVHNTNHEMDHLRGFPLIRLRRAAFRSARWRFKRVFDIVVSALALVALSPLMAAVAIVVRIDGGRDIIFRQTRVGLDNRPIEVLKFRSMRPSSEQESQTAWNIKDDARLGRVGRFIRCTSLDELPQLWNVLRGDLSLVGPRPERPYFVDAFSSALPRYLARHRVPAGMTGWAQVHGLRGDTSIEERVRFDNYYIENWSLWLDIRILLMTLVTTIRGTGS